MATAIFDGAIFDSAIFDTGAAAAAVGVTGGGGGVARWPGRVEADWEKWRRFMDAKERKRLAALRKKQETAQRKVERLEFKVEGLKEAAERARVLETIQSLIVQIEEADKQLLAARQRADELEMEEVAFLYAAYRQLH